MRPTQTIALILLALAVTPLAAQVALTEAPRRYLVIRVEGANRDWEVRPIRIQDRFGGNIPGATQGDFETRVERWDRTGLPRKYLTDSWRAAFQRSAGASAPEGARFVFYAINPRQPLLEGKLTQVDPARRMYSVPAAAVSVVGYPRTWVDIWEAYVGQFEGEQRREAVIAWEAAHREIIANAQNKEDGFTQEERNAFAVYYQQQFVYIRDREPKLAAIYDQLAAFHNERGNLDAALSTYLDGLRAGVDSPDRERFHLEVGRILVNRLKLDDDAREHLQAASGYAEARWLHALALSRLGRSEEARSELASLISLLASPPLEGALVTSLSPEDELGRAHLLLGEVEMRLGDFRSAGAAVDRIAPTSASHQEGRLLFASMLLYRNEPGQSGEKADAQRVRDIVRALPLWNEALAAAAAKADTVYPLDSRMSRALVLYVQADQVFGQPPAPNTAPAPELINMLTAAKALDPLTADPFLAEGRLYQRFGRFREAMDAYMGGLNVNPRDALLNYKVADLHLKAGVYSMAKDYLARSLKHEPDFYPALARLGEIAVLELDDVRAALLIKRSAGEPVDYAAEIVPPLKEAAAFFTASLAIYPQQPPVQLALATLYLQLAEFAPLGISSREDAEEVRRAYLTKARDLADALVRRARAFAAEPPAGRADERSRAEGPNLAAFNVFAYAAYALGDSATARAAFREHLEAAKQQAYFVDSAARTEYQVSQALAYAHDWLRRIDENERRYFEVVEFQTDSTPGFFGGWKIYEQPKPDSGFAGAVSIRGGRLNLAVDQKENAVVSRIELEKPNATLAVFEAEFVATGDAYMNRGIHITRCGSAATGKDDPQATVMLGVDAEGRVYYETRRFRLDNPARPEEPQDYELVDVRAYGGLPLAKDERLTLAIRRRPSEDRSRLEYFAVINGYEVRMNVTNGDLSSQDLGQGNIKLRCGFFAQAPAGTKAAVQVQRARFVYDSALGGGE